MFFILNELHFWTLKETLDIKDTDLGAFSYCDKKPAADCILYDSKKDYAEKRGILWTPNNKRPFKLKDALKELEELLRTYRVLNIEWRNQTTLQIIFSHGLIASLRLAVDSADLSEIHFDRYMCGKLHSDYVVDVAITNLDAIFTYADNQVSFVSFMKPLSKEGGIKKWSALDPKSSVVSLAGPTGRRLDRKVSFNVYSSMVLFWWKCGQDEVYPWSPIVRDQDRANVHIYQISGLEMQMVSYLRTEFDPLFVSFSCHQSNVFHCVQQKISHKGEVTLEWLIIEVSCGSLETKCLLSLLLPTHCCLTALSPKEDQLFIACIDGSLLITDSNRSITSSSKATFVPTLVAWHSDSCLIVVANERAQIQWFDSSLQPVRCQFVSEDNSPSNVMDVGAYFKRLPRLSCINWSRKNGGDTSQYFDDLLLLHFERGPLAVLRLVGSRSEVKFTADTIIGQYLSSGQAACAVNLLLTVNWDTDGDMALSSLQSVVSHLLKLPLTPETEILLERAIGSFHNPKYLLSTATEMEYGDPVHDLSRKFFHHLLRYQVVEKAYRLAIDLEDYDLFMDIHNYCKKTGNTEMAVAALEKADQISVYSSTSSGSGSLCSECSASTCSCCSETESSSSEAERQAHYLAPPLPVINPSPQPAPRQKVKFSNTVTQISMPDHEEELLPLMDTISLNTVGLPNVGYVEPTFHHRLYVSGGTSSSVPDSKPLCLSSRKNNIDEAEGAGKIKVIHFGLV